MSNDQNPNWQQFIDWIDDRLSLEESARIEAEVADSAETVATDLAWLRAFKEVLSDVSIDDPPQSLRLALRASFAEHVAHQSSNEAARSGLLERFVAALSFDSNLQLGLAGARAASTDRQLIYSTDAADISLSIRPEADGLYIDAQILPLVDMDCGACTAQLIKAGELITQVMVDEMGLFTFTAVEPELYQVLVASDSLSFLIDSVDLQR